MSSVTLNNPLTTINSVATATADTTTTATVGSPALMNGMTITPSAGTYLVTFGTTVDHSAQAVAVVVSLFVGGVQDTDTVRSPLPRFNAIGAQSLSPEVTIIAIASVDGTQAVEIKWGTASGTATAHQRTLNVIRIA